MLKRYAIGYGVVFLVIGVLGFIPAVAPNGYLLGIIQVDALHNWVHLLTGIVAIVVGLVTERASQLYFQIFGVVYALVAILGLFHGNAPLLGIMAHNWGGFVFHVIAAAVALYFGFGTRSPATATARSTY